MNNHTSGKDFADCARWTSRHRPLGDVLFRSVVKCADKKALGILVTGMDDDGANGPKEMHDVGARTLGQDEDSCVAYGMEKEALKPGAVNKELPLEQIAYEIVAYGAADSSVILKRVVNCN